MIRSIPHWEANDSKFPPWKSRRRCLSIMVSTRRVTWSPPVARYGMRWLQPDLEGLSLLSKRTVPALEGSCRFDQSVLRENFNDHRMIAYRQRNGADVFQGLDWIGPNRCVVDIHFCVRAPKIYRNIVRAAHLFAPYHQLEGTAAFLQQKVVHSGGLIRDGIIKFFRIGDGEGVGQ